MKRMLNIRLHWKVYSPLQVQKLVQVREYMNFATIIESNGNPPTQNV